MGLTVKGQPINKVQVATATGLLSVAGNLNAGSIAAEACIFDAIYESSVGNDLGVGHTYGGVLGGAESIFDPSNSLVAEATAFFQGGKGFQGGGAIALARVHADVAYIGCQVTAATPFDANGYSTQYLSQGFPFASAIAEAKAIIAAYGGGALKGGTAGSGGSGTIIDGINVGQGASYAFQIGGANNPDEDYWTGTNRLAQDVAWYYFSNGEYLYFLDGQEMIAQKPALTIDRIKDAGRLFQAQGSLTWDDTSFQYVSKHKRKFRVQRKTSLTMVTSPTQATLQIICGIDEIRGGDVIELTSFGPGDGRWIVGDCRRSVFNTYSELRLVPPISPITEAMAAGTTGRNQTGLPAGPAGNPTGKAGNLASPFAKKMSQTTQVDMGVDFGNISSHYYGGDPILAIGDCYLRRIDPNWYQGQPCMFFELTDKSAGYWGWYVAEGIRPQASVGPGLIKGGTRVATFASGTGSIEIGWAASPTSTAAQANGHAGQTPSPEGTAFLTFLHSVGGV